MTMDTPVPQRRGRRLPTTEELRVWRDYIETAETLRQQLAAQLQRDCSLSPADYVVLLALSEAPEQRMRSSQLADAAGWTRSRLSHHLARMQRRTLIHREEPADDSRGADVVLTPTGAQAFHGATVPHLRAVREIFVDALTPEQLAAAGDIAATLRAHLGTTR
ncbi:DNA-binding transcriptional regulator, MarR family [Micromonospora phaseoli]|uniref:DNA-binding transcriptional regulator, MarR family n=1 Tax=Micromonospora phaseoli TaxID=1144548 RepID=A0A1H6YIH6_9ACTN|nr:MarR family winged helix-turn-helix transcriptional regulator [Micromonospora phaseoli]PZW00221.1 DNA-binding MarR family transcriptional regulator [Micromonospora phaseoli]GIJ78928.1 MarR family transcriptional regulator [Micromonospora phaseoli]SEJ41089.1 DNA-binding transcriptional regulator, MarR family [Micromonospora phaseoli]